ncbi:MAG: (d)CMP kinase [Hyphomonadaceae bacterium]|nr:(d)CMP kinase [Hyphomonadaceae bacterium]
MIIAVDGPTASGKGTVSKRLAAHYGLPVLDTGAIYRAVGLAVLDAGGDPAAAAAAEDAARALDLSAIDESRIRTSAVGGAASVVAAIPAVRAALLDAQRAFARQPGGAVLDGRDIGTVVAPFADVKLYVTATLPVRAERRFKELRAAGEAVTLDQVEAMIAARDARDSSRDAAPAVQAPDAHVVDTTDLTIEEAVAAARAFVDQALRR